MIVDALNWSVASFGHGIWTLVLIYYLGGNVRLIRKDK